MQAKILISRPPITNYKGKAHDLEVVHSESVSSLSNDDDREAFMHDMFDKALTKQENDLIKSSSFTRKQTLTLYKRLTTSEYKKQASLNRKEKIKNMSLETIR